MELYSLPPWFYRWSQGPDGSANFPGSYRHLMAKRSLTCLLFLLTSSDYCWRIDQPCYLWPGAGSAHSKGELGFSHCSSSGNNFFLYTCSPSHVAELFLTECWRTLRGSEWWCYSCLDVTCVVPLSFPLPLLHCTSRPLLRHCTLTSEEPSLTPLGLSVLPECSIVSYIYYDIIYIYIYIYKII